MTDSASGGGRHIRLTSHPGQQGASGAPAIHWGAADALRARPDRRHARRTAASATSSARTAAATASTARWRSRPATSTRGHRADLTNTAPTDLIGPYPTVGRRREDRLDRPLGRQSVQNVFADYIAQGYDIRPTIAVTKAHIHLPEIKQALAFQRLQVDGKVLLRRQLGAR